ncbi:MAG: HEAT repeat domain-containing protein, partial [Merismopedia sp. SIO2A8]|nr:HEAT repeat domain-containing protein [Merismopedia sp. SIO2A8]
LKIAQGSGYFEQPKAKAALVEMQQDQDYRVVGATLERLLQN